MKIIQLIIAVALTVVILILSLQNVAFTSLFLLFTWQISATLMMPMMLTALLGIAAGALYAISIRSFADQNRQEEEEVEAGKF